MEACFDSYDKDGDGQLSFHEFCMICQALFRGDKSERYAIEEQKLKEIFEIFDQNGDEFIDRKEFAYCWTHWIKVLVGAVSALLIVDVQNDFISGSFNMMNCPAKQDAREILDPINYILDSVEFRDVIYTMEWHPSDHISFIDNLPLRKIDSSCLINAASAKPFDTVIFTGPPLIRQTLLPRHCVQNTWGAELHQELKFIENGIKILKGVLPEIDCYSAFFDSDKLRDTGLDAQLRQRGVTDLYICGVPYDYNVKQTAIDALNLGYRTILIEDCLRGMDLRSIQDTRDYILKQNGVIVDSSNVKAMVEGRSRRPELAYKLALELRRKLYFNVESG
ncbi:hypothetical protein Trydic_g6026 [Trypoxylus dichotomus]